MNVWRILDGYRDTSAGISRPNFCLWGWLNSEIHKRNVDTPVKFIASILDAAGCIKKREDQLRRTTHDLHTRVAKCTEVGGGILERLL
jgi:hypothetical protein